MIAEVREAIRLDRLYPRLRRERAADPLGWALVLLLKGTLWLGVPALAVLAAQTLFGHRAYVLGSMIGVALGWALCHWLGANAARTDAFRSLRMPSRVAHRASRWLLRLPWFLYCGALWCGTAGVVTSEEVRPTAMALAFSLPLLQGAMSGGNCALRARFPFPFAAWFGLFAAGLLVPVVAALFAFLPSTRVLLVFAAPLLSAALVLWQIRLARSGEVALEDDWGYETDPRKVHAFDHDLPARHAGASGLAGAARARRRAEDRLRGGLWLLVDLPVRVVRTLLRDFPGPLLAAVVLGTSEERTAPILLCLTAAVLLMTPLRRALEPDLRFWLYGALVRDQYRVRLRSLLLFVALPTLGVSVGGLILLGPTPVRVGLLATIVATMLFRAGSGALWNSRPTRLWRRVIPIAILSAGAAGVATGSPAAWWALAGVAAALGGLGLLILLRAPEEVLLDQLRVSAFPGHIA